MKRICFYFFALFAVSVLFASCSNKAEPVSVDVPVTVETPAPASPVPTATPLTTPVPTPSTTPSPTPTPNPDLAGKALDPLTGLYIDADAAALRPIAVTFDNHHLALPQSGLSQADLYYEVLAEGDITRIIGIFQDFDSAKIGPVRSARPYFVDFALNYDAIFIHYGGSDDGYAAIKNLKANDIDGLYGGSAYFWRDPTRASESGMFEHSAYTSAEKLRAAVTSYGYRADKTEDFSAGFGFYSAPTAPAGGQAVKKLTVPYSAGYPSQFVYDNLSETYKIFEGADEQPRTDEETGEQLSVTNVLVQITNIYDKGDALEHRVVETVGKGSGYLLTNGVMVPVKWSKTSDKAPTVWTDANGNDLLMNPGKTWVCVFSGKIRTE